jgi:hypothetical protein
VANAIQKKRLQRTFSSWEENIKNNLGELKCEVV